MKRTRILMLFLGTLLCSIQLFAQQITIQGTVYDPSGPEIRNHLYGITETVPGTASSFCSVRWMILWFELPRK